MIHLSRKSCVLLSSPKKIFPFFCLFFSLSHGFPPLFHKVDLGQFLPSPVFSITQMDQKKQPFSCSNHSLNENEKIFQLFLLVSIFSPVSGSVAPRTYYTNCSFPKSDCQQKAGNQSNNFDWNFHYFGSFLVLIFANLFAPQEI